MLVAQYADDEFEDQLAVVAHQFTDTARQSFGATARVRGSRVEVPAVDELGQLQLWDLYAKVCRVSPRWTTVFQSGLRCPRDSPASSCAASVPA